MNIKNYLDNKLKNVFDTLNIDRELVRVAFSDKDGVDLQCNSAFQLAKMEHMSPIDMASKIVNEFEKSCNDFECSVVNGFINFRIKDEFLSKVLNDAYDSERLNLPNENKPKNIIIDYGGANIAKPLHIGHMRSAIIGQALYRLNKFMGNKVVGDVHLGDWGLQMGLTIAQLMDDYDMGYYFGENKPKVEITIPMLDEAYPKASARKKEDPEFLERASNITLWLQQKKKGYFDIWKEFREVSVDMVKNSYANFGVTFDLWNGESTVNDYANDMISDFKKKKLIYESDGAFIMDVAKEDDKEPMPPAIIQKHNGAQMYIVTDVATIAQRYEENNNLNEILYVADNRQALHFKQVFRVVRKAQLCPDDLELKYIAFGTVNGTDGKPFKTRDGGTVKLDDVVEMIRNKALEKLKANGLEENNELAQKIGVAALLFGDMINVIGKDYVFDLDKFCSFDGKTGPYLQYTAVRIKSLLNKSNFEKFKGINVCNGYIRNVAISLLKFYDSFYTAYKENTLNSICQSAFDLASAFSTLYNDVKILKLDENEKSNYLSLCLLVLKSLTIGLGIIGIEIPEYM